MDTNLGISLKKKYIGYAIPSIVAMWVFSIYTMVDGFFVARYVGNAALSAVNLAMPFVNTLFAFAIIFGIGTSTAVGILLGQERHHRACEIFTFTTSTLLLCALAIVAISLIFINSLVSLLGAEGSMAVAVKNYISIILWFSPFFMISYHFEILVKIDGFPKLATIAVTASAVTNIALDYLFVGVLHMGISGAAVATGIAQILSTVIFSVHFLSHKANLKFRPFPWDFKELAKILPLGIGDLISEFSTGFIVFLHNRFIILMLGTASLVTYTVLSYTNLLIAMTMTGLTQGMQPLMSYYFGRRDSASCKKLLRYALISITGLSIISIILINIFSDTISGLFISEDTRLLAATSLALKKYSLCFIFLGYNLLIIGYFASIGKAKSSILISLCRGFVFIYVILQFLYFINRGEGIWFASAISEFLTFLIMVLLVKKTAAE